MPLNLNKDKSELIYYYSENGLTIGPFSLSQLLNKIDAETLVYREGINWTSAKNIEELKTFFSTEQNQVDEHSYFSDNTNRSIVTKEPFKMFMAPFSFNGRIRRKEYGISFVIYILGYSILLGLSESSTILLVGYIPLLWFLWAQGAKRCHDRGNSGWYQIIPFYVFWMLFAEGDSTKNEYGNSPK